MTSVAGLRAKAVPALILYNLLFILPLIVVFMLAYYGTESKVFTRFLKDNAAPVKLGMAFLFIGLGIWLLSSLIYSYPSLQIRRWSGDVIKSCTSLDHLAFDSSINDFS